MKNLDIITEIQEANKRKFEIKKKIVLAGDSRIFKDWQEHAGITQEDFIEGLKWLSEDPLRGRGSSTRELGCDLKGLHKVRRVYSENNYFVGFYDFETGLLWNKSYPLLSMGDKI